MGTEKCQNPIPIPELELHIIDFDRQVTHKLTSRKGIYLFSYFLSPRDDIKSSERIFILNQLCILSRLSQSMPNANHNHGIDPKYLSMPTIADQFQSIESIGIDAAILIGIGHWLRESCIIHEHTTKELVYALGTGNTVEQEIFAILNHRQFACMKISWIRG